MPGATATPPRPVMDADNTPRPTALEARAPLGYVTLVEACSIAGMSRDVLLNRIMTHKVRGFKVGWHWYVCRADLRAGTP